MNYTCALVGALFATSTLAHMQLHCPPPFNASNNPHRTSTPDPYLQYPYDCCGPNARWEFPCRGYLSLLGTPEGAPTASWEVGSSQTWSMSGIGNHYGGSCQVGFSVDRGDTFRVARSYEGNCPHRNGGDEPEQQNFDFLVPDDIATGVQVFAWIWYNREREFNMNCAAVNITARTRSPDYPPAGITMSTITIPVVTTWTTVTITPGGEQQTPSTVIPSSVIHSDPPSSIDTDSSQYSSDMASSTSVAAPEATDGSLALFKTANGCSCTCETPTNIETCNCYCHQEDADLGPAHHVRHLHYRRHEHSTSEASSTPVWVPFDKRPLMFIADDANGCLTPKKNAELKYPDPGPHVQLGDGAYPLELPSGDCGLEGYHRNAGRI